MDSPLLYKIRVNQHINYSSGPRATGFWTYRIEISNSLDLLVVICPGQLSKTFWVKLAAVGEELGTVLFGQLCAE